MSAPSNTPSPKSPDAKTAKDAQPAAPRESEHAGRVSLGKYRLLKKVGSGGMGAVFQAEDTERSRVVAIKILPKDKAKNPTLVKRFKSEAQAAANLSHENIVQVFGAGEADGYLYISMEYIEGTDVQELVSKHGILPVKRSLDIIRQMARALEHTGSMNLAHRDIKPSNLLIRPDGVIKLTDLGLARFIDEETETGITRSGYTVGTVDYMAPEQARDSKSADVRSDIYSLGCTWYFMLTGQPPYPEGSVTNKISAHALNPIPDPRKINPDIPEAIVTVINRMLTKSPEDRYQSGRELLADLKAVAQSRDNTANRLRDAFRDDDAGPARPRRSPRPSDRDMRAGAKNRRSRRSLKDSEDTAQSNSRIQIQIDPLRFVMATLVLVGALGGAWWISQSLSDVANPPPAETRESLDPTVRPSAPTIKPTP
jgi:eukaryotic-like serine/threonine-protein kinase